MPVAPSLHSKALFSNRLVEKLNSTLDECAALSAAEAEAAAAPASPVSRGPSVVPCLDSEDEDDREGDAFEAEAQAWDSEPEDSQWDTQQFHLAEAMALERRINERVRKDNESKHSDRSFALRPCDVKSFVAQAPPKLSYQVIT